MKFILVSIFLISEFYLYEFTKLKYRNNNFKSNQLFEKSLENNLVNALPYLPYTTNLNNLNYGNPAIDFNVLNNNAINANINLNMHQENHAQINKNINDNIINPNLIQNINPNLNTFTHGKDKNNKYIYNNNQQNLSNIVNRGSDNLKIGEYNKAFDYYSQALDQFDNINNNNIEYSFKNYDPNNLLHQIENDLKINSSNENSVHNLSNLQENKIIENPQENQKNNNNNKQIINNELTEESNISLENKLETINADKNKKDDFIRKYKKVLKKLKKYKNETKDLQKDLKYQKEKINSENKNSNNINKHNNSSNNNKNDKTVKENKIIIENKNYSSSTSNNKNFLNWINKIITEKLITLNNIDMKVKVNSNEKKGTKFYEEIKIIANQQINKNQNLLKIDKKLILSKSSCTIIQLCSKTETIKEFKNNFDKICLALNLIINNKNNSEKSQDTNDYFNENYLTNFKYENFPIFFSDKELKLIKGTFFNSMLKTRTNLFEKEYNILIKNKIIKKAQVELKEYIKSRSFVISKNINLYNDENKISSKLNTSALVPILDKIKINPSNFNTDFIFHNSILFLNSTRKIEKGEEITIKPANMSNQNLLLYYGYTIKENLIKSEIYLDVKININSNSTKVDSVLLRPDFELNKTLVFFRKMVISNNNYFDREAQAINLFKKSLNSQLTKFINNYKSDELVFKTKLKNLTQNEINIYRVIIEEKKRVHAYFNLVNFFDKIYKMLKVNKSIPDHILRKISTIKAYKKYYESVKNIFKSRTTDLKDLDKIIEKELLVADENMNMNKTGNITINDVGKDNNKNLTIINTNPTESLLNGNSTNVINKNNNLESKVYNINLDEENDLANDDDDDEEDEEKE